MALDDGRVISNFIVQTLRGKDLTLYGERNQTRSFCCVDDMVGGLLRTMAMEDLTGPVNLGNPSEFTIQELAQLVLEVTGSRSQIIYKPLPSDDPARCCPDIVFSHR